MPSDVVLDVLPGELAVCRLERAVLPEWADGTLLSFTVGPQDVSLICAAGTVPEDVEHTPGWRGLAVRGPLSFELVGIAAGLTAALSEAGISVLVVGSHHTDYLLVTGGDLAAAVAALRRAGHRVEGWPQ